MKCKVDGCDQEAKVKGMCRYHYGKEYHKRNYVPHPRDYSLRFFAMMTNIRMDPETGCWNYPYKAARTFYQRWFRPLTRKEYVCHKCDNPYCVNPDHLFVGTAKDNMQDCVDKNRIHRKVGQSLVEYIRTSPKKNSELARELGLCPSHISAIRLNKIGNWSKKGDGFST